MGLLATVMLRGVNVYGALVHVAVAFLQKHVNVLKLVSALVLKTLPSPDRCRKALATGLDTLAHSFISTTQP